MKTATEPPAPSTGNTIYPPTGMGQQSVVPSAAIKLESTGTTAPIGYAIVCISASDRSDDLLTKRGPRCYWKLVSSAALLAAVAMYAAAAHAQSSYKGTPYQDSQHHGGVQKIPGRVECAFYDRGGEGVAYHDTDAKNS